MIESLAGTDLFDRAEHGTSIDFKAGKRAPKSIAFLLTFVSELIDLHNEWPKFQTPCS